MKICFVLEHFYPHIGGVETVFFEYAKRLTEKGNKVKVITSNSGGTNGVSKINGFEVIYLKCPSFFGHPLLHSEEIKEFIKWADIIHTTTYTAALPAIKLAKKFKKPCLITVHEAIRYKWFKIEKNPLKALGFLIFENFVIKKPFDYWHVISKSTKDDLLKYGIPEKKIILIYHGIDGNIWNPLAEKGKLNEYLGFDDTKKIFLYSGRPGKTKGIFILLEAIKNIKNEIPSNFGFGFILSDDPLSEKECFERLVKKYNLRKLIKVQSSVKIDDLVRYRRSSYAVIIPSITEGFGFNAAEASALGIPIISSDAGSLPEIASGKLLFFKNGNIDDLSKKIILASKGLFEAVPLKNFSWDDSIEKLILLYQNIINTNNDGK